MEWLNPPAEVSEAGDGLWLRTRPGTDFWQETHYGFRRDDGHFLHRTVRGDFDARVAVRLDPGAKYDQAGLMVRIDAGNWLKTSLEFEPEGPSALGAVVTNAGLSDWSMRPVDGRPGTMSFEVKRRGPDYTVFAALDGAAPDRIRLARLHADDGKGLVLVGPYACSPTGPGCQVAVLDFTLDRLAERH